MGPRAGNIRRHCSLSVLWSCSHLFLDSSFAVIPTQKKPLAQIKAPLNTENRKCQQRKSPVISSPLGQPRIYLSSLTACVQLCNLKSYSQARSLFPDKVWLYISDNPGTHCVAQADPKTTVNHTLWPPNARIEGKYHKACFLE